MSLNAHNISGYRIRESESHQQIVVLGNQQENLEKQLVVGMTTAEGDKDE
jgi:hypothetical protein